MSTITITITAPAKEFSIFADELGYQSTVIKSEEELALLPSEPSIQDRIKTNPETRQEFLERKIKEIISESLSQPKIDEVEKQIYETKESEKLAIKNAVSNAILVSS